MRRRPFWQDHFENVFVVILLALVLREFIFLNERVRTPAMQPTLVPGDFVLIYQLPFGVRLPLIGVQWGVGMPRRGEVVVFSLLQQPLQDNVKRVIGLPGDRVEWTDGLLKINGQDLQYTQVGSDLWLEKAPEGGHFIHHHGSAPEAGKPVVRVVPPGEILLLGDNRDDPEGLVQVPAAQIHGQVSWVWLSLQWDSSEDKNSLPQIRQDRLFTRVQ